MSEYIGLTALKEAVGLGLAGNDTVDDSLLRSTIFRASALVDNYLSQIRPGWVGISAGSNSRGSVGSNTRRYDGTGSDWLWIDDASSVSAVAVDDTSIAATAYELWPYNESPKRAIVYVQPSSSIHGLSVSVWSPGTANVDVTGYFGLNAVPDDVAQVTLALSVLLWRRYQSGEPTSEINTTTGENDPELTGILQGLYPRWGVPWVGGA